MSQSRLTAMSFGAAMAVSTVHQVLTRLAVSNRLTGCGEALHRCLVDWDCGGGRTCRCERLEQRDLKR
jgi:hypothetical protein